MGGTGADPPISYALDTMYANFQQKSYKARGEEFFNSQTFFLLFTTTSVEIFR